MRLRTGSCLLAALLCGLVATGAQAQRGDRGDRDERDDREFRSARVSDLRGDLTVRGDEEDDYSYIYRNAVVRSGDTLWTDEDSRAELELPGGVFVRMSEDTKLEARRLSPGRFRLWTGNLYLENSDNADDPIRLDTPAGDVSVEPNGIVRVDFRRSDRVRVSVYRGRARAIPDRGEPVRLRTGDRVMMHDDEEPGEVRRFDREDANDALDEYELARFDYYRDRPLPDELDWDILGARDLNDHGRWVNVEGTRYWRPRVQEDWRPYSEGHWSNIPGYGYTWIDDEPWGYTTTHYGRWTYRPQMGYLWYPTYDWAPAYVQWARAGDNVGWAPLDPYNRPVRVSGRGLSRLDGMDYDPDAWTYVRQNDFYYGRHHMAQLEGRKPFLSGSRISRPNDVHVVRDVYQEIGVPRERVRGLVAKPNGLSAREKVLKVETKVDPSVSRSIEKKFGTRMDRDRVQAQRPSNVERLQKAPDMQVQPTGIVKGAEATQRVKVQAPVVRAGEKVAPATLPADATPRVRKRPASTPVEAPIGAKPTRPGDTRPRDNRPDDPKNPDVKNPVKPRDTRPDDPKGTDTRPGKKPGDVRPDDPKGTDTRPGKKPGDVRPDDPKGTDTRPGKKPGDVRPGDPKNPDTRPGKPRDNRPDDPKGTDTGKPGKQPAGTPDDAKPGTGRPGKPGAGKPGDKPGTGKPGDVNPNKQGVDPEDEVPVKGKKNPRPNGDKPGTKPTDPKNPDKDDLK